MPQRRKLNRDERKAIYEKCAGHCAYCGIEIATEQMQVDHAVPITLGGKDELINMLPSCRSCNRHKDTFTIEKFRQVVENWHDVLMRGNVTYRNAVRFRMIEPHHRKVIFYFETFDSLKAEISLKG